MKNRLNCWKTPKVMELQRSWSTTSVNARESMIMAQSAAKHPGKPGEGSTSRAYGLNRNRHGYEAHDWRHRRHGDDVLCPVSREMGRPMEFGRYYDVRMVKTNHGLSNAVGASSAYGEAYFFGGGDPVLRGIATAMKVIPKEETDFQRSRGLAWYCVEAYRLRKNGDPDNQVVKSGSL